MRLASNESPYPPLPAVRDAIDARARGAQSLSRPDQLGCCGQRLSDRYGVPAVADRDRQRLVRHPAGGRRGAAGARRRARLRLAVVLGLPAPAAPPPARARSRSRSTTQERHDLPRCSREITVATRLVIVCNPNNPTSTALPLSAIARFVERGPAARLRDRRRGLLRVQPARRSRRVDRAARAPPQPRAAADLLEGLRPVRAARRLCAVRLATTCRARSTRCASRSSATRSRRRRRVEALAHQDAVARPRHADVAERDRSRRGAARAGPCSPPSRRRTSAGSSSASATRPTSCRASPSAACSCARGTALGERRLRCASPTARREENSRFLDALGGGAGAGARSRRWLSACRARSAACVCYNDLHRTMTRYWRYNHVTLAASRSVRTTLSRGAERPLARSRSRVTRLSYAWRFI